MSTHNNIPAEHYIFKYKQKKFKTEHKYIKYTVLDNALNTCF